MIARKEGIVLTVKRDLGDYQELEVEMGGEKARAVNYPPLTGPCQPGDRVLLNTTAVELGLGTGGFHYVMANFSCPREELQGQGHIMKLRYTPMQLKVLAAEEEASPWHQELKNFTGLKKTPVVCATLHSQLPAVCVGIQRECRHRLRVVYVMTDGAALPLAFSRLVRELKEKGLISATVTCGHAFGGDLEAVNLYSALAVAKVAARADVIVIAMGPGIVGTGSKWGYTGVEQGQAINAVHTMGGKAIAVPRLSFADPRPRHQGVSHHTLTALAEVALAPCQLALPRLEPAKAHLVRRQLTGAGILTKHRLYELEADDLVKAMVEEYQLQVTTMGRSPAEDREFFAAAAAAGRLAARQIVW
ncbi:MULTISPECIES: DUF3866 family protein [unclassified Carboxydocella]|uniref:DUF3866 family protein n=1 Tax=unclassified Carboxydocella TaxID=2685367 RepID=UPI0009C83BCA|nr:MULTISPECIES: DUF3866 family protein [unclassified Carboxydocella]GAW27853.1 hypothetical protein ULO1_04230 [Carboxydocella sp. ULO1]GAW32674.1 hypothetical protein JDF658_24390 [Carboxydocella sp. JDF658]